jgi:Big-like domain-containing protein/beta-propeller repeat-containing protein
MTAKIASDRTERSAGRFRGVVPVIGAALVLSALTGTLSPAPPRDLSAVSYREIETSTSTAATSAKQRAIADAYGKLPLAFVPNAGQTDQSVRYSARVAGASFHFTQSEAVLAFKGSAAQTSGLALRLAFLAANPETRIEGQALQTGKVNYLTGRDPSQWRTGLPTFGQVVYRDLWPGIDMTFRGDAGMLKYEFLVRPGASVDDILLAYRGAEGLSIDGGGDLLIATPIGSMTDLRPVSYQEISGRRVPIESRFVLEGDASLGYGFAVGDYDPGLPLVIDPGLVYSTYLGGGNLDIGNRIRVDSLGNAYITGETEGAGFPTTLGAFDTSFNSNADVFVTKLNLAGTGLVYSTFLGGGQADRGLAIAIDSAGNAYITGETNSTNFPMFPVGSPCNPIPPCGVGQPFDNTYNGGNFDAFVTKLNAAGNGLLYSTYLGGSVIDKGHGIAADSVGNAYVTGETTSTNFPTNTFDTSYNTGGDAFVAKINTTAVGLASRVYSAYLGGTQLDIGYDIVIDATGSAYVTGETRSSQSQGFPLFGGFDMTHNGAEDAFITKLNPAGTALVYSTYLGGSSADRGFGIARDAGGNAYITGETNSTLPTPVLSGFDTVRNSTDGFMAKLNAAGNGLLYLTYLGGSGTDIAFAIAVDTAGNAYVTGETNSTGAPTNPNAYPTTPFAFDRSFNGDIDAFVTKINPNVSGAASLVYSTYLGGSGDDRGLGIAVDAAGSPPGAYVVGMTNSTEDDQIPFPTTFGAYDRTHNEEEDAFVTKFDMIPGPPTGLTLSPTFDSNPVGTSHTVTATVVDAEGDPIEFVTVRFSVTGVNPGSGTDTTDANGEATFTYTGNNAGADAIHAYADTDTDNTQDAGEPFGDATKTWTPAGPTTLTLSPVADTNPVGTTHTVTATASNISGPVAGVTVRFSVTGSVTTTGQCTTNSSGQCDFMYNGPTAPGADAITAYADTDNDNTRDAGEPIGAATKTWTPGAPATLVLSPTTDTNTVGEDHIVMATVTDAFGNPTPNIVVRFSVTGTVTVTGFCTTDPSGQCTFTYSSTTAGTDAITAYADTDNDNTEDPGEPAGAATKVWTAGAPATLVLSPTTDTNTVGDEHCVTATVKDAFGNPTPGITVRFSVTGANSASGSDTTDANGVATFCYTGTAAGTDAITAYADTDNDNTEDPGEPAGAATKIWTAGAPATLTLEPAADVNTVGEDHTVTATVRDAFGNPVPGVTVRFTVNGATFPSPSSGSDVTDANGEATFTYSASLPGIDAITAYADTDNDNTEDAGEPAGTATKTWIVPGNTALCEVKITEGGWIITMNYDRANFGGNARVSGDGTMVDGQQNYRDHGPADPRHVKSTELLATTCSEDLMSATIFGKATIDDSPTEFIFRIDVTDVAEPGRDDTYGIMMSDGYVSGQQQLQGGNVQIHKN